MKAIILDAGGNGALQNILRDKPKAMLEISDTNLLTIQIDTLYKAGIEDVAIVRGYGKEYIDIPGIRYYDNADYAETGVLYSLFCAEEELNEDVLIIYGDIAFSENVIKKILAAKKDFVVGAILNYKDVLGETDYAAKEMLTFNSENCIQSIGKNLCLNNDSNGFFSGILKCSRAGAEILRRHYQRIAEVNNVQSYLRAEDLRHIWLTDFLNELCALGVSMNCTIFKEGWHEVDTQKDYQRLCGDTEFMANILAVKTDWNERSKTYNNIQWVNKGSTLDCMVRAAASCRPKRILDLGTGTGKVLSAMKEAYADAECYGIDISAGMMDKIKEKEIHLSIGKIEDLSRFADDFFDVVTARMVLHHSTDLAAVYTEVKRVLRTGGKFIVCEGNPPSKECLKFYEEMFRYKETRHTFLIDDLTNLSINAGFDHITADVVTMRKMSLNNWLENAGVPFRNIDMIRKMHYHAEDVVKRAYDMQETDNDLLMTWKFSVVSAQKV